MKNMRRLAHLAVLAGALFLHGAQAQQGQTAEGAQKFLAALAKKGAAQAWFVDAQGRTNHVRGRATKTTTRDELLSAGETKSERVVEKQLGAFVVTEIDSLGPDGKGDACMTRMAKLEMREPLVDSRAWNEVDEGILIDTIISHAETSRYEPSPELLAPHWIDWRNVKLARSANGAQMTASFKEKNFTAHLTFIPGEPELVDRIEYAMKFLKLSCDDTTATGF